MGVEEGDKGKGPDAEALRSLRGLLVAAGAAAAAVEKIGPEDNLFERGLLDSVAMIGLVVKIEKKFKLRIPEGDFEPENFSTLGALDRLIARCPPSKPSSQPH